MKMKKNILIFILMVIILFVGCQEDNFTPEIDRYKESYIKATNFVEISDNSFDSVREMDIDLLTTELKNMKDSLDKMSQDLDSKKNNIIYENLNTYYQEVEFFVYAYNNLDNLTIEERRKVETNTFLIKMSREDFTEGNVI